MTDHGHYFPILKGKRGEFEGLSRICPGIKPSLTPLIEVQPIPLKYDAEPGVPTGQECSLGEHLNNFTKKLLKAWGNFSPVLIDSQHVQDSGLLDDETHPLVYVLNLARTKGIQLIPVTGLDRNDSYQSAIISQAQTNSHGVCVRVERDYCRRICKIPAPCRRRLRRRPNAHVSAFRCPLSALRFAKARPIQPGTGDSQ